MNMTQQRIVLTLGGQLLLASSPAYNSASSSSSSSVAAAAAAAALLPGVSSSSLSSSVSASASTAAGGPSNSSSLLSSPAADNLNNIYTPSRLIIDEATPRGGSGRSNVCVGTGGVMDDDDVNRNNDEESEDVLSLSVATTPCSKRIRMATAATITAEVRMENQDILQQVGETRGGEDQSSRSTLVHLGIDDIIPIMSPPPVLTSIEGNGGEGDKSLMAVEESEVEMGVDVELAQGTDQTNNNNNNNIFINSNNVTTSSSSQYHQHRQRSIIISLAEKNKENNPAIASKSSSSPGSGSNNNNNGVNAATSITDDQENENRYFPIFKPRKPRLSG